MSMEKSKDEQVKHVFFKKTHTHIKICIFFMGRDGEISLETIAYVCLKEPQKKGQNLCLLKI